MQGEEEIQLKSLPRDQLWPKGIRCAAIFTFDNDDEFGMIDAFGSDKMF
jgi:hypothetical protein